MEHTVAPQRLCALVLMHQMHLAVTELEAMAELQRTAKLAEHSGDVDRDARGVYSLILDLFATQMTFEEIISAVQNVHPSLSLTNLRTSVFKLADPNHPHLLLGFIARLHEVMAYDKDEFLQHMIRQTVLAFNQMELRQVLQVITRLATYCQAAHLPPTPVKRDTAICTLNSSEIQNYLTKQATLLEERPHFADSPHVLHAKLSDILTVSQLPEVYYVAFLNSLRLSDSVSAEHYLAEFVGHGPTFTRDVGVNVCQYNRNLNYAYVALQQVTMYHQLGFHSAAAAALAHASDNCGSIRDTVSVTGLPVAKRLLTRSGDTAALSLLPLIAQAHGEDDEFEWSAVQRQVVLSGTALMSGCHPLAAAHAHIAALASSRLCDSVLIAWLNIAAVHEHAGEAQAAVEIYSRAAELFHTPKQQHLLALRSRGDPLKKLSSLNVRKMPDLDEDMIRWLSSTLPFVSETGTYVKCAELFQEGLKFSEMRQYDKALSILEETSRVAQTDGYFLLRALAVLATAVVLNKLHNIVEAVRLLDSTMLPLKCYGSKDQIAFVFAMKVVLHINLCDINEEKSGDTEKIINEAREALKLSDCLLLKKMLYGAIAMHYFAQDNEVECNKAALEYCKVASISVNSS